MKVYNNVVYVLTLNVAKYTVKLLQQFSTAILV